MNTPIIQSYFENPARPGTFDCVYTPDPLNIPYFKLSTPRNERFKAQGAVKMIETWTREGKPLFSGLVPLKPIENIFFFLIIIVEETLQNISTFTPKIITSLTLKVNYESFYK